MHTLRRARLLIPKSRLLAQHATRQTSSTPALSKASLKAEEDSLKPISSILIANRGEIALRVNRTASERGIRVTTLYTDPDSRAPHAHASNQSVNLGSAPSAYLDSERIVSAALDNGCEAIHPGYGFLSENAAFAKRCTEAGIKFLGPPWQAIEAMGNKSRSKEIMTAAGVPCIPGYHGANQDAELLKSEAARIGYPVLIKAVKGGGGKGMRIVQEEKEFLSQLESARTESRNAFGDEAVLVERYIGRPRHIEVQVFADKHGNCVALGERDCSVQRRHQKILEESPAPHLDQEIRKDIWEKARAAALAVGYEGAGTVEFIFDNDSGDFFFMEMNTRLQVEHPVTEMVTGLDLVDWQLIVAQGGKLPLSQEEVEEEISKRGHAIEARIYAENPDMNFMPDSGKLIHVKLPNLTEDVRVDAGFVAGDEISSHYDPMIAKLIVRAPTRTLALQKLKASLESYEIAGPITNVEFLKRLCVSPGFVSGDELETGYINQHKEELFEKQSVPTEAYVQAGIGLLLAEREKMGRNLPEGSKMALPLLGGNGFESRIWSIYELSADGKTVSEPVAIQILEKSPTQLIITINGQNYPVTITPSLTDSKSSTFTTYFPHTLHTTTLIRDDTSPNTVLTLWHLGKQHRFTILPPKWLDKALGNSGASPANSVVAPMPCKVLRVDVNAGDRVVKDQVLAVVESMKMETVIRSPVEGVVKRVVHGAGDMCKAGTALVEFEEEESS